MATNRPVFMNSLAGHRKTQELVHFALSVRFPDVPGVQSGVNATREAAARLTLSNEAGPSSYCYGALVVLMSSATAYFEL
jgi:hypothetical protein